MGRTLAGYRLSDSFDDKDTTAVRNVIATLDALGDVDAKKLFGDDVELDRLKITQWSPDTCGCVVDFIWHREHPEETRVHHPHRTHRVCARHAHLAKDRDGLHAEVRDHNRHKNHAVGVAAELVGVPVGEIGWSHDDQGVLVLAHEKLTAAHLRKIASHPDVKVRKVRAA